MTLAFPAFVVQFVNPSYDPVKIEAKMKKLAAERNAQINAVNQQKQSQNQRKK